MQVATGRAAVVRARAARFVLAALQIALLAALPVAGAAILPAGTAVAKPSFTPEEKAYAIVRPAVVFVEVHWKAWVRDKVSGDLVDRDSISLTARCSGFAVSNDGFLVTAGHCVDPGAEGIAPAFYEAIANRLAQESVIRQDQVQALIRYLVSNGTIQGEAASEPAIRTVFVQRGVAKSGLTSGDALEAKVVSFQPVSGGDVALLKIEKSNQPMVTLADADINIGADVVAIGYPASADAISDATMEPSNQDGKISNKRTEGGVPFYETNAATTQGMSGGPVASLNGEIVGLVSHGPAAESQAFNFVAASSVIAGELAKGGVKNQLGRMDNDYRDGLDAYYDGRYSTAIEKFDKVIATVPTHTQAQKYRQDAINLREKEGEDIGTGGLVLLGAAGICLFVVIVVVIIVVVAVRSRKRSRQLVPAGPYPMTPVAYPPISVPPNPQSRAPYAGAPPSGPPTPYSPPTPYPGTQYSGTPYPPVTPPPVTRPVVPAGLAPPAAPTVPAAGPALTYCTNCGHGSPAGTTFCATCGQQFN